jgi:hypothetical protein
MSYSFTVEAKDGVISVPATASPNASIPAGRFVVTGHEEDAWLSISIARMDETGAQVAQASDYGKRT